HLPPITEDTFPGVLANVIAGRIANRLDLGGENCTVSAACASSLSALSTAVRWLESGDCDMAIAGGADLHNAAGDYLMFSSVHALSRRGRCRTFDEEADGIVLGEGVAAVVLKRLADARRDGDRVYAVVRGVGASSDGRSMGLTAPRLEGQVRAFERAYEASGVEPAQVGLIEAHGTGTVVGDRTELQSMTRVFGDRGTSPRSIALGSVKSQIGHTKNTAGMAALVKTALSLYHRVLPPTLHVETPNPFWDPESSPFAFHDRARPWIAERRLAGISSFGFGGTNYHAVLEEAPSSPAPDSGLRHWPAELFLLRGEDRPAALERARLLGRLLERPHAWRLRDLARTVSTGGEGPIQAAFVARDLEELGERVERLAGEVGDDPDVFVRDPDAVESLAGKTAFLYPGQGSQYRGMLAEIFIAFPELRELLDLAPEVVERMYPPQSFTPEERERSDAELTRTDVAQVALGITGVAMTRVLERLGLDADMVAGHSYGEIVALSTAGAWDEREVVRLSAARARAILDSIGDDPGTMVAVARGADELEDLLADHPDVVAANRNAPRQTILSGPTPAMESVVEALGEAQIASRPIKTACAFHSPMMSEARDRFRAILERTPIGGLDAEVWANATAGAYPPDEPDALRDLLADQIVRSVRFVEQIEAMYQAGARVFVEVGPNRVLTGLVSRILGERPHVALATDVLGESPLARVQRTLARLATLGVAFDVEALYAGRDARRFDLEAGSTDLSPTAWHVDGHRAWPADGAPPATPPTFRLPLGEPAGGSVTTPGDEAPIERAMLAYLDNVREMIESQRDVMLEYLGAGDGEPRASRPHREPRRADVPAAGELPAPSPVERDEPRTPDPAEDLGSLDPLEVLTAIVSERTGYPPEMLDPDLDLEGDLSIDSIKRIEILGILNDRVALAEGLGGDRDAVLEELALVKTLRGMAEFIEERAAASEASETGSPDPSDEPDAAEPSLGTGESSPALEAAAVNGAPAPPARLERRVFRVRPLEPPVASASVAGRRFLLTDDGLGVAEALADLLRSHGAEVGIGTADDLTEDVDAVVHLAPLATHSGPDQVKELFDLGSGIVGQSGRLLIGVTGTGGTFGEGSNGAGRPGQGGVAGFLKSFAKEWPEGKVRAVDVDPTAPPETIAGWILAEITGGNGPVQVAWREGRRRTLELVTESLPEPSTESEPVLDENSVVLITGGARGITAHVSIELARRFGCALELVGRTPAPAEEEPATVPDTDDPRELKRRLLDADPEATLAEIESRSRGIRADREVRSTLEAIEAAGGRARYHSLDVRDSDALGGLVDEIYERHGRLDGVIHAAGAIEDKLLVHKTRDSFNRVFDTKVTAAMTLANRLRSDTRFLVFFSSLAGVVGNAGQTDYAAANDVLDTLALHLNEHRSTHVLSVDWGPWDATGMVGEDLRREYTRRGIGLIPVDAGVQSLIDEIARGSGTPARVVLMSASDPDALD
ncbi:MAG: SDR family NAD(P)-dependent oxidoreductase, partial [Gemmatimonadota bacterium]|nr:SDR family NAD(P)-dependent oxidoreductase [Gemmatimonadota bacterium]